MAKRKKATRAYKIGFTDGCNGEYNNNNNKYYPGSVQHDDYERGYAEGAITRAVASDYLEEQPC